MKILTAPQIRAADAYTIANEPIASIDLMERAARAFSNWFLQQFKANQRIVFLVGAGNNGGDALAIARMLSQFNNQVWVLLALPKANGSPDFNTNLSKLPQEVKKITTLPNETDIIIDGLFGSGLTRPLSGQIAHLIEQANNLVATRIAIDIASGLTCDGLPLGKVVFKPHYTVSFQLPKLAFMLPENQPYTGHWHVVDIGLHPDFLFSEPTPFHYQVQAEASLWLQPRTKFAHKGNFGHGLLVAGSYGKMGSAMLAGQGMLRSGIGLGTTLVPACGYNLMQLGIPELMCLTSGNTQLEALPKTEFAKFTAIGIGPGIGTEPGSLALLTQLIEHVPKPMVLDADAINLIAQNPELLTKLPAQSILTPHVGEFERLTGKSQHGLERLTKQQNFSKKHQLVVVLKGAHTSITDTHGQVWFNSTGNPGMATGGSGDVLTGLVTGLLAQGYPAFTAARLAVYLHGLAGDIARQHLGEQAMAATDIAQRISDAFILLNR